jgi:cytochrome oxidase Cu insertion factor (SCO1/SenC/PrrC family)
MTPWLILVAAIVVIGLILVAVVGRRRSSTDDIASFRRQIDALSPEARRPTIERMNPSATPSADEDGADGA